VPRNSCAALANALRFGRVSARVLINPARREPDERAEGDGRGGWEGGEEYARPIVIATANDKRTRLRGNERKSRMKSSGCGLLFAREMRGEITARPYFPPVT